MDVARREFRPFNPVAPDKDQVYQDLPRKRRAARLAETLLGAPHQGRRRFSAPCRLHPLQPRQTRLRRPTHRLEVQQLWPMGRARRLPAGLGYGSGRLRWSRWERI